MRRLLLLTLGGSFFKITSLNMKKYALRTFFILALAGLLLMPGVGSALTVLQLNLEQLYGLSEKVFLGRCLSVRPETDAAGRRIDEVTFEVEEMLKGKLTSRVTFRQLSSASEVVQEGPVTIVGMNDLIANLPVYQVGEEVVVFLSAEGEIGLTAPVGLYQGKFSIVQAASGIKTVRNGLNNRGLFVSWRKSPRLKSLQLSPTEKGVLRQNGGEIRLEDFLSIVHKLSSS